MSHLELFHHQITGPENGRRWVFVHGLMGYSANWRKIVSGLESSERVLVYDQRGHGRSIKPETGYSPEDYAEDLHLITSQLGWDQFILVGHSMGGRNVVNFAYQHPEKVTRLVVEDIGLEASANAVEYYEKLLGVVPTPFANRDQARKFFQTEFLQKAHARDRIEVLAQFFYSNIEDKPDGTANWRFSKQGILQTVAEGRAGDRWKEVESLKMPTLWIRGKDSKELSRENYERILKSNPLISGIEIPNAAHWVHADQPGLFLQALKDFAGGF
jgi:esterase